MLITTCLWLSKWKCTAIGKVGGKNHGLDPVGEGHKNGGMGTGGDPGEMGGNRVRFPKIEKSSIGERRRIKATLLHGREGGKGSPRSAER